MRLNQKGFSAVEILIVIVVITLVGFVGWRVYDSNQDSEDASTSEQITEETNTQSEDEVSQRDEAETQESDSNRVSVGSATVEVSDTWKVNKPESVNGGDCVLSPARVQEVVNCKMLILSDEEYESTDGFHVTISTYDASSQTSVKDWYINELFRGVDGNLSSEKTLEINGADAYMTEADYSGEDGDEIRLNYVVLSGDTAVVLNTTLFNGQHYSFTSERDYLEYRSEVEELANSIQL